LFSAYIAALDTLAAVFFISCQLRGNLFSLSVSLDIPENKSRRNDYTDVPCFPSLPLSSKCLLVFGVLFNGDLICPRVCVCWFGFFLS